MEDPREGVMEDTACHVRDMGKSPLTRAKTVKLLNPTIPKINSVLLPNSCLQVAFYCSLICCKQGLTTSVRKRQAVNGALMHFAVLIEVRLRVMHGAFGPW